LGQGISAHENHLLVLNWLLCQVGVIPLPLWPLEFPGRCGRALRH
jgi:hypothetical protein